MHLRSIRKNDFLYQQDACAHDIVYGRLSADENVCIES